MVLVLHVRLLQGQDVVVTNMPSLTSIDTLSAIYFLALLLCIVRYMMWRCGSFCEVTYSNCHPIVS